MADLQAAAGLLSRRKVQVEDDITASVVLPRSSLNDLDPEYANPSVKLVEQLRDAAVPAARTTPSIAALDRQAEADMASPGTFLSNYEPLTYDQVRAMVDHVVEFDRYTEPMKRLLAEFTGAERQCAHTYVVSSAHPRLVNGKPSKNPRYLQKRPDLVSPRESYLAEIAARLEREIPSARPVHFPVNAVLAGRRNNPPDPAMGMPPLAALQSDSLPGIAGAVHGVHLQPDGQVALDHRLRQRRRADQRSVQRPVAGGGSEQRAGIGDSDRLCRLHHLGRCASAPTSAWITT